jgi:hypothetical protein
MLGKRRILHAVLVAVALPVSRPRGLHSRRPRSRLQCLRSPRCLQTPRPRRCLPSPRSLLRCLHSRPPRCYRSRPPGCHRSRRPCFAEILMAGWTALEMAATGTRRPILLRLSPKTGISKFPNAAFTEMTMRMPGKRRILHAVVVAVVLGESNNQVLPQPSYSIPRRHLVHPESLQVYIYLRIRFII